MFLMCRCVCLCLRPWKFEHMATDLLSLLLRDDHPLPPDAVLFFTQSLIHDSISIRKVCSCVCVSPVCLLCVSLSLSSCAFDVIQSAMTE